MYTLPISKIEELKDQYGFRQEDINNLDIDFCVAITSLNKKDRTKTRGIIIKRQQRKLPN